MLDQNVKFENEQSENQENKMGWNGLFQIKEASPLLLQAKKC